MSPDHKEQSSSTPVSTKRDQQNEWTTAKSEEFLSLNCPNCGSNCLMGDYECGSCNSHLYDYSHEKLKKFIDQIRREAKEDYSKFIQPIHKLELQEAKIELIDELIVLAFAYTNDDKDMYEIIDYMKSERAKTLGDNKDA